MKASIVSIGAALLALGSFVHADNFANFFDDASCTQNGGIGVDITNDGCLNEAGRGSVYIPNNGDAAFTYCLVITSNDGTCSCQNVGYNFTPTGFCKTLNPNDQSYRFIQEACGGNNC